MDHNCDGAVTLGAVTLVPNDRLEHIMRMQADLVDYIFKKCDLRNRDGQTLTCACIINQANALDLTAHGLLNHWLREINIAIADELEELNRCLPWKYWSRDGIGDKEYPGKTPVERLMAVRVEYIDILHFTVEALLFAGATDGDVYRFYSAKSKTQYAGDQLEQIIAMQQAAIDHVFAQRDIRDRDGRVLTCARIAQDAAQLDLRPVADLNQWLRKVNANIAHGLKLLNELLPAEYNSDFEIGTNAFPKAAPAERLEVIKMMYLSILSQTLTALIFTGATAADVYAAYHAKWTKNIARQDNGYRTSTKTEQDNDEIAQALAAGHPRV